MHTLLSRRANAPRSIVVLLVGVFAALGASPAFGHVCGSSRHTAVVGEAFAFTIWADVFEELPTDYSVITTGDPNIATIVTPFSFSALGWGRWGMLVTGTGTTTFTFFWSYAPNAASGFCTFEVESFISSAPTATTANYLAALKLADPVSTLTGELTFEAEAELDLGGPMPLRFESFYGSHLLKNRLLESRLGNNWLHRFDLTLIHDTTTSGVQILFKEGRILRFSKPGTTWNLDGPTDVPYQLVESGANFILGDPRKHLLYTFDVEGRLATIEDGKGNTHTLSYSGPILDQVSDGLGRTLAFAYNDIHLIQSVSDGTRSISFGHGFTVANSNLTSMTDAGGNTTTYAYDPVVPELGLLTVRTRPEGNVHPSQSYDVSGRVSSQSDGAGNTTTISYGASTVGTDPLGNTLGHSYDADGGVIGIEDPVGNTIAATYDADGRRSSFTDRDGDLTSYAYHALSGKVATSTSADGAVTGFAYTARAHASGIIFYDLTQITHPDGAIETFVYDAVGNLVSAIDRAGATWIYSYNGRGQLLTTTLPLGGVTVRTYGADGTLATSTDTAGNVTAYGYDLLRRLTTITHADTTSRSFTYDANDNVTTLTDEAGRTTGASYDGNGNLRTITDPAAGTTTFSYDGTDRPLSVIDPLGNTTNQTLDPLGRLATVTDAGGNTTTFSYDARGRLVTIMDAVGAVETRSYSPEDIRVSTLDPLGRLTSLQSDSLGRHTQVISPTAATRSFGYDANGRLASVVDPLGNVTGFAYDAAGRLASISMPEAAVASYTRNALGQIISTTDPRGFVWIYSYDTGGRRTGRTDPLGNPVTYVYDTRGRIAQVDLPLGSVTLVYDAVGNVVRRDYQDGTVIDYGFDALDRLVSGTGLSRGYDAAGRLVESNGITVGRDAAGRIASVTLAPGKTLLYQYDGLGQVTVVTDWVGGATSFSYDAAGRLISLLRPNAVTTTYAYNDDDQLTRITDAEAPAPAIVDIALAYDAKGQLLSASRDLPTAPALGAASDAWSYDAASQVSGFGYDNMGRLVDDGSRTYTWDLASRLTQVDEGVAQTTNGYDALGYRVSRTAGAEQRSHVWNHALAIPSVSIVRDGLGDLRYYVHAPNGSLLHAIEAVDDSRLFYHFDEARNTVALTDDAGAVVASYAYSPFGRLGAASGAVENPFTWQGQVGVMDEGNGLFYLRSRFYDSVTARFLTRDADSSVSPRTTNPYTYALADPIGRRDPFGLFPDGDDDDDVAPNDEFVRDLFQALGFLLAGEGRGMTQIDPPAAGEGGLISRGDVRQPIRDLKKGAGKKVSINALLPSLAGTFLWLRVPVSPELPGALARRPFLPAPPAFDAAGNVKHVDLDTLDTAAANSTAPSGPSVTPDGSTDQTKPGAPPLRVPDPSNLILDQESVQDLNDIIREAIDGSRRPCKRGSAR